MALSGDIAEVTSQVLIADECRIVVERIERDAGRQHAHAVGDQVRAWQPEAERLRSPPLSPSQIREFYVS